MPLLTGSLVRVPLGIWTDRYGGRIVMALLMASTVPAIWLMSYASAYWHFIVIGLFVGLAAAAGVRDGPAPVLGPAGGSARLHGVALDAAAA